MYTWLLRDPEPDDPAVRALRARLDAFYAKVESYFDQIPDNAGYHHLIEPLVAGLIARRAGGEKVRVLEVGAGRATFPNNLSAAVRARVEYHAQDVTPQNAEYLAGVADRVIVGDVADIAEGGAYDLVFSTYVLEHVAAPRAFLGHVRRLLSAGGHHVVICPNYEMPGYVCPSLRHLPAPRRLAVQAYLAAARLAARAGGRPRFFVNADPSMFHGPWYTDADAVHVVSQSDVARWHRANGFRVRRLALPATGWKGRVLRRALTTSLVCTRVGAA